MSQKNKKEVIEIPTINENWLKEHVYIIRNQKVMLDSDLAMIYGYEVKYLNRQVKRNIERFPEDFMFQVTKEEVEELRCQNVTANINTMSRTMPYVFSEQGIYMLATVLNGEIAIKQHKALIRMFKLMKDYIVESGQINSLVEYSRTKNIDSAHDRMNLLEARVQKIEEQLPEKVNTIDLIKMMEPFNEYKKDDFIIIYKGKPLQANIAYNDIYKSATKTIDIIDDYIGLRTLSLLTGVDKDITIKIYSHNMSEINEDAFNSFVKECPCRIKNI